MEAIRNKQEPKIKANSAYGLLPLVDDLDQDEHTYDYVHLEGPQATPAQLAPDPGRGSAVVNNNSESSWVEPSSNEHSTQLESMPDYDRTFATLNRRAPKFSPTQVEHLIAMLKNTHCSSQDVTGDSTHEESSGDSETYLPLRTRSTSPQPYYVDIIVDKKGSVGEDEEKTSESLPNRPSKSHLPHYVNYLTICDHGREVSTGVVAEKGSGGKASQVSQYYVNYCDVMGGSTPKPTSSSIRSCRSYECLSRAVLESPNKVSKRPMPAPKPSFVPKPTKSYLQPIPDTHRNPRKTLSTFHFGLVLHVQYLKRQTCL